MTIHVMDSHPVTFKFYQVVLIPKNIVQLR